MINEFNCFLKKATIKIAALILLLEQHVKQLTDLLGSHDAFYDQRHGQS
jgi:hypothetical protein